MAEKKEKKSKWNRAEAVKTSQKLEEKNRDRK